LKKDMTVGEYMAFEEESGINWGEEGIIAYGTFLQMSYEK
jgi:hypothetical protein